MTTKYNTRRTLDTTWLMGEAVQAQVGDRRVLTAILQMHGDKLTVDANTSIIISCSFDQENYKPTVSRLQEVNLQIGNLS